MFWAGWPRLVLKICNKNFKKLLTVKKWLIKGYLYVMKIGVSHPRKKLSKPQLMNLLYTK